MDDCQKPCSRSIMMPGTPVQPGVRSARSIKGVTRGRYATSMRTPPPSRARTESGTVTPASALGA